MATPKDVLVITTSPTDRLKIKKYLKPVSAHIVAGTNLFSDFLGGMTDVFGGRSQTYQKQLTSLYNEAIEKIKIAAYEIGGNCIIGLNIDMDEISGKGKSMFMITAIGTAIIIEKEEEINAQITLNQGLLNVGVDQINILRNKKAIIEKANTGDFELNEERWGFITQNQVEELFPFILKKYATAIEGHQINNETFVNYYKFFVEYIDALPEERKLDLLYSNIETIENEELFLKVCQIVKELNLLDINRTMKLLQSSNFQTKKRGLRLMTYDKQFYNNQDILDLQTVTEYIMSAFKERGTRTTKKQLLSSKEKEVWTCECGKSNNEIDEYCGTCAKDISGFKVNEKTALNVATYIQQKIELIKESIK